MASLKKASFAGGEVSPRLWGRADQSKYQSGLKTCRNWIVTREGVATNRPGTEYVMPHPAFTSGVNRLIPFVFSSDQSYILVFTDFRLHFIRSGEPIFEAEKTLTALTAATPPVATVTAHGYSDNDLVYFGPISTGSHQSERRFFRVDSTGANTFELMDQADINGTGWDAYSGGISVKRCYSITTPYAAADLAQLRFSQSADVITITHPDYAPYNLSRASDTSWTLAAITFEPSILYPEDGAASGTAGADTVRYRITAVDEDTLEESFAGIETRDATNSINSNVAPMVVTYAAHPYSTGDEVFITYNNGTPVAVAGLTGTTWFITKTGANTFTLDGSTALGLGAAITSQDVARTFIREDSVTFPSSTNPIALTWTAVTGAIQYNIYREVNGIYGYIGSAVTTSFEDLGYSVDASDTPPIRFDVFAAAGDYPTAVGRFQQRLVLGGSTNDPESNRVSRIGLFYNFTKSNPIQDDDSIRWIIADEKLQRVKHYIQLNTLFVCTQEALWSMEGDDAGTLTPTALNPRKRTEDGISDVRPLVVGKAILYVQYQSNIISELTPGDSYGVYNTSDLTIFSQHLFEGYAITDWSHARIPYSVVWSIRDDGTMLGLTYLKEQQVQSWHRHDTGEGDEFTGVCCIPEGSESATYVAVTRYDVEGQARTYFERMATRQVLNSVDGRFLDSYREYESANSDGMDLYELNYDDSLGDEDAWWISPNGGASPFTEGIDSPDIGRVILMYGENGERFWCTVQSVNSTDQAFVSVTTDTDGLLNADGSPSADFLATLPLETDEWSSSVSSVDTLWHLEGRSVMVIGDGFPQGPFTVADGSITLAQQAVVIAVGIPIEADIKTLDPDYPDQETLIDKPKTVSKITALVEKSSGLSIGLDEDHLNEEAQYKFSGETANGLKTGRLVVQCSGRTDLTGNIFIRQSQPLPATVLTAVPTVSFGRA